MNNKELNRDVKRLAKRHEKRPQGNTQFWTQSDWDYSIKYEETTKEELRRLYFADTTLKAHNKTSVLILLLINLSIRAIPLHLFGCDAEL